MDIEKIKIESKKIVGIGTLWLVVYNFFDMYKNEEKKQILSDYKLNKHDAEHELFNIKIIELSKKIEKIETIIKQ